MVSSTSRTRWSRHCRGIGLILLVRNFSSSLETPSLWILGEADRSIPIPETRAVLEGLRAAGRPVDIEVLPGVGHGMRDARSAHEVPLRTLHKGVCARYDELSKLCHGNSFAVAFLVDQLEHCHGAEKDEEGKKGEGGDE